MKIETIKNRAELAIKHNLVLKDPFKYKMGGIKTLLVLKKNKIVCEIKIDKREYYSGKRAKIYNNNICHDEITETIQLKDLNKLYREQLKIMEQQNNKIWLIKHAKSVIKISDGTHQSIYSGCGVYRIAYKNGEIKAAIYGGYFNNKPTYTDRYLWDIIIREELAKFGEIAKVDGSGGKFYARYNIELPINAYYVPNKNGWEHLNLEIQERGTDSIFKKIHIEEANSKTEYLYYDRDYDWVLSNTLPKIYERDGCLIYEDGYIYAK